MIPEDVIQEIKLRANIGDVIGRYVKLKRRGKNLVGLCPFHQEKTPSFNVHPDDGYYKCFGCGESGDVFKFVEKQTGQDFPIVVRSLAEEVGIEVPDRQMNPEQERRKKERDGLLKINDRAQLFYRQKLVDEDEGRNARAYLAEGRKLDQTVIDHFGLGYGGARDNGLLHALDRQGVPAAGGVAAGVLREGRNGPYDFFRSRVTFPIRDYRGRILTFAGRVFGPGSEKRPKYVNGPQTPLYDKSSVLYGLYEALPGLKKGRPAVLVEGQVDVLAIWRSGVATGVAPCGTSLTPRHVEAIKRYSSKVVLCLDADAAGQAATERAVLLCLNGGLEVAIAELVEGDPDDMVSAGQGEVLAQRIEGAPPALDLYIERAVERSAGSMNARISALHDLLPFLAASGSDELSRRQYVKRVARAFQEDESFLYDEIAKVGRKGLAQKTRAPAPARAAPTPRPQSSREQERRPERQTSSNSPANRDSRQPREGRRPQGGIQAPSPPPPNGPYDGGGYDPGLDDGPPPEPVIYDDGNVDPADDERGYDVPEPRRRLPARVEPPAEWSDAERGLVRSLICHPSLAPRCGVLLENMRNLELRRFVADLTDALVRFHTDEPRDVLKRVGAPTEVQRIFAEVYFGGGVDHPSAVLSEGVAAEMIESYVATLERRPLLAKLKELQRGIEAATERGDLATAETMMKSQQVVVAGLRLAGDVDASPLQAPPPRLRLVEPAGFRDPQDNPAEVPKVLLGPARAGALGEAATSGDALEPDDVSLDDDDFAW